MRDKYTIYPDGKDSGLWKIVEMAHPNKVIGRGMTGAEARRKCAELNGK